MRLIPLRRAAAAGCGTFDALDVPAYRKYFLAMLFYFGAMQATALARPVLAFDLADRAPIALGVAIAANNAPSLALSPFAGALADKTSMRNILIGAAALMALLPPQPPRASRRAFWPGGTSRSSACCKGP